MNDFTSLLRARFNFKINTSGWVNNSKYKKIEFLFKTFIPKSQDSSTFRSLNQNFKLRKQKKICQLEQGHLKSFHIKRICMSLKL